MKHYTLFNVREITDPYGVSIPRGRIILTETDEPLSDTAGILRKVLPERHGPFVDPVVLVETFVELPEKLVRGAMLLTDREDVRCWVLPITGDVDVEVPEV